MLSDRLPSRRVIAAALATVTLAAGLAADLGRARADDGDPAGWSVLTDPRRRAFLIATDTAGGPRLLTVACLRDVDEIALYATLAGLAPDRSGVGLSLSVADASLDATGSTDTIDGAVTLTVDLADGAAARKALAPRLKRLMTAPGPLVVAVDGAASVEIPLEDLPPRRGIAGPWKTFDKVCFGR